MSDPASGDARQEAETLAQAQEKILACEDADALKAVEREYLGKKGIVAELLASIPDSPPEERPQIGQRAHQLKQSVAEALESRRHALAEARVESERQADGFDPSLPPPRPERGSLHPLTLVTRDRQDLSLIHI